MIDALQDCFAAALVIVGSLFALTASIGLLRLPDFYTRRMPPRRPERWVRA